VKLGLSLGYAAPGFDLRAALELGVEADRLGYDSAFAAEAYSSDAVVPLAWLAARTERIKLGTGIMQLPGRSPANAAMTAMTLDLLSGGRFVLGLGTSGPQVVEGWHGQPWGKPLTALREYVEVVRAVLRRDVVQLAGERYRIPYDGPGATGLGKPLKLGARPLRSEIPIWLAVLRPRAVALAAEIADGWMPIFYDPEHAAEVFGPHLSGAPEGFEVAPLVNVRIGDDVPALRDEVRPNVALYVGGMGAKGKNFYNDLFARYGFEREAAEIQELYLGGRQLEAIAKVPDAAVDRVCLVGTRDQVRDRLDAYREAGVTTLIVSAPDAETLRTLAELVL
jgi:F420-dependent oxidoreductase-like protein